MNKFTFFIKWMLQRESNISARQVQFASFVLATLAFFLSKSYPQLWRLFYFAVILYVVSYVVEQWQEYRRRKAYEDWKRGHQPRQAQT